VARLKEKGGKVNEMGCHHKLEQYLDEYIAAAGIAEDKKGTAIPRRHRQNGQAVRAVHVARRCMVHGAPTGAGCGHRDGNRQSFFPGHRVSRTIWSVAATLINIAKRMAGHSNVKTTELYDRRGDEVSFSEIERMGI
jgi:integrase/recombinase XerD